MSVLPDPDELLAIADRLAGHADAVRRQSRLLEAMVARLHWDGVAALAFELGVAPLVTALHRSAGRLDDAADAMRRHAATVRRNLDALNAVLTDLGGVAVGSLLVLHDVFSGLGDLGGDTDALVARVRSLGPVGTGEWGGHR